jgi:two-component system, sensor histidine kinase and response regulator
VKPVRQSELRAAIAQVVGAHTLDSSPAPVPGSDSPDSVSHLTGLSIPVAEDNAVNQKLIVRMLEKRGHKTEVVVNGLLALYALARRSHDAVLMDVQIPELDGLDATSRLRIREGGTTNHQIVIALTVHAMKGSRPLHRSGDGCLPQQPNPSARAGRPPCSTDRRPKQKHKGYPTHARPHLTCPAPISSPW